jgi:hypothetical protein
MCSLFVTVIMYPSQELSDQLYLLLGPRQENSDFINQRELEVQKQRVIEFNMLLYQRCRKFKNKLWRNVIYKIVVIDYIKPQ